MNLKPLTLGLCLLATGAQATDYGNPNWDAVHREQQARAEQMHRDLDQQFRDAEAGERHQELTQRLDRIEAAHRPAAGVQAASAPASAPEPAPAAHPVLTPKDIAVICKYTPEADPCQ